MRRSLNLRAPIRVGSKYGNIPPHRWVPIRVVITLFGTFKTVAIVIVAVGVLAGISSFIVVLVKTICSEQAFVTRSCAACVIGVEGLLKYAADTTERESRVNGKVGDNRKQARRHSRAFLWTGPRGR